MKIECGKPSDPAWLTLLGPIVRVHIGFDPKHQPVPGRVPNLPKEHFHALVDTGATMSCIDADVASRLDLPEVDQRKLAGVHGVGEADVYLGQIYIPDLKWTIAGRFSGVHLRKSGLPYSALLGRTFLAHMHMAYDGKTGSVIITRPDKS